MAELYYSRNLRLHLHDDVFVLHMQQIWQIRYPEECESTLRCDYPPYFLHYHRHLAFCVCVCQSQLAVIYKELVMPIHYSLFMGTNEVYKTLFYINSSIRYTDMLNDSTLLLLMATSGVLLNTTQKIFFFVPYFRNVFTLNLVAQHTSRLILYSIKQVRTTVMLWLLLHAFV